VEAFPTNRPAARWAALIVALVLVAVTWIAHDTLLLAFAGVLIALFVRYLAEAVARVTRLPMVWNVWLSILVLAIVLAAAVALVGNAAAHQIDQLRATLPAAFRNIVGELQHSDLGTWLGSITNASQFAPDSARLLSGATGIISGTLAAIVAAFIIVFVGIAGALESELYVSGFVQLFPSSYRAGLRAVLQDVAQTLRLWLAARLFTMATTGLLVTLGLTLLHVPFAGGLGFVAGTLAFIPNLGAFVAAAPAVIIALAASPMKAVEVAAMYVVVHIIDDFILSPVVERQVVKLPPILTLLVQIVLGIGTGIVGIMLAAPLVAVAMILVRRLWTYQITD
jgi:predicted PurR-regulated permease PerM